MKRSKAQVLYNYLPNKTFDYDNDEGIHIVKEFNSIVIDKEQLHHKYVTKKISNYLNRWTSIYNVFSKEKVNDDFYFCRPLSVKTELFPLVFQCVNENCKRIQGFQSLEEFRGNTCKACGKQLRQVVFVALHECGNLKQLYIPPCPTHGKESIILDNHGSQRVSNMEWRCNIPGCTFSRRLYQQCNCTELPNKNMTISLHTKSDTYYPHSVSFINLRDNIIDRLLENEKKAAQIIIAAYLGLFDFPKTSIRAILCPTDNEDNKNEQLVLALRNFGYSEEEIKKELEKHIRNGKNADKANKIIEDVSNLINIEDNRYTVTAEQLMEYIKLDEEQKIKTSYIDTYYHQGKKLWGNSSVEKCFEYINKFGLNNVKLIENLPVTTAVFGYSRLSKLPNKSKILPFPSTLDTENKYPVYVDMTNSEAIAFELDFRKVFRWLKINNLHSIDDSTMGDTEIKAWFINNLKEVDLFGNVESDHLITKYTYGLVHSFSHLVLKGCTITTGFDKNSLSEYLFYKALSFIIYYNNRQSFVMGGMFTAFEERLPDIFDRVKQFGNTCIYDPICNEKGGSCHGCMHIAEYSCSCFNYLLSRMYLYGGIKSSGERVVGYFEID